MQLLFDDDRITAVETVQGIFLEVKPKFLLIPKTDLLKVLFHVAQFVSAAAAFLDGGM